MTSFEDGPAKGQVLMLKRSPNFLRVTEAHAKFDALDLASDSPLPGETLYAYKLVRVTGFVCTRPGGCYPCASYKLIENQPDQSIMVSKDKWYDWCLCEAAGINTPTL